MRVTDTTLKSGYFGYFGRKCDHLQGVMVQCVCAAIEDSGEYAQGWVTSHLVEVNGTMGWFGYQTLKS
jgi:hypothetical protein